MKTCPNPKCKATGIPDEANFCPTCGQQLVNGEVKLIRYEEREKFIYLTNYTDVLFDVTLTRVSREWLYPRKTIQLPNILYKNITAKASSCNSIKTSLKIEEHTPSHLKLVFANDKFVMVEDD